MQCVKEMLWSDQAHFFTNPLTSKTSYGFAFERSSVSIPTNDGPEHINQLSVPMNDSPAQFKLLSVPNDIPAISTSSFNQLHVPMIATFILILGLTTIPCPSTLILSPLL
jgi:hypothetical protein